jgi:hypothetical protein
MWNHRIIRHIDPRANTDDSIYYAIHETYYDEDGKVNGWATEPVRIMEESLEDIKVTLQRLVESFDNPVLDAETKEPIL